MQRAEHGPRQRDRVAAMILLADEVELGSGFDMTGEAVYAEPVVDVGEPTLVDL